MAKKKIEDITYLNEYDRLIICNGARPNWLSHLLGEKIDNFMKPYFDLDFKEDANKHDVKYWRGVTKKDKKIADKEFKKAMKRSIKRAGHSIWTRWFYYYKMHQYFLLVSYFGDSAFNWSYKLGFNDLPSFRAVPLDHDREKLGATRIVWISKAQRWYTHSEALKMGLIRY